MGELSMRHCRLCENPEYACDCIDEDGEEPDDHPGYWEPALSWLMRNEPIPEDHPYLKNRRLPSRP